MRIAISILALFLSFDAWAVSKPPARQAIVRGDEAWERRGEGRTGATPDPDPIAEAVAAYEEALGALPDSLEARWKLMRALYFLGEHATRDSDHKLAIFRRARDLSDESRQLLAERVERPDLHRQNPVEVALAVAGEPDAGSVYLWSAVHWGLWGRQRGKFAAARQGVAKKIRRFAEVTIQIDERLENASGHRILGRLHSEAPKLVFFTGWIDRDLALAELERAVELAPGDLLSRLYLVEVILDHHRKRRDEALALLRDLVEREPNPDFVVEEEQTLRDARALQARLEG